MVGQILISGRSQKEQIVLCSLSLSRFALPSSILPFVVITRQENLEHELCAVNIASICYNEEEDEKETTGRRGILLTFIGSL